MFASHYVIQQIYHLFDIGDIEGTKELFNKFTSRYPADMELKELKNEFLRIIKSNNNEEMNKLKDKFKALIEARKLETSGGISTLTKKGRRPGIDSWIRLV